VTDNHYSTIDPLPDRNIEDQSITNSTRQQDEQLDDALLGDINNLPRVIVTQIVTEDGRVIETLQLTARHHGLYESTRYHHHHHHHQQEAFTGQYEVLRRSLH